MEGNVIFNSKFIHACRELIVNVFLAFLRLHFDLVIKVAENIVEKVKRSLHLEKHFTELFLETFSPFPHGTWKKIDN